MRRQTLAAAVQPVAAVQRAAGNRTRRATGAGQLRERAAGRLGQAKATSAGLGVAGLQGNGHRE